MKKIKISKKDIKKSFRIFKYVNPYKTPFFIGFIFLFLSSISMLVFPFLMGNLIDYAQEGSTLIIHKTAIILLLVFLANAVFSFFRIYLFSWVTQKMLADLRTKTYNHIIHLPILFFDKHRVGEITSRIAADISLLQNTFTTTIAEFVRQIIIIIGGIILLTVISIKLTLFMLAIVPVLVLLAVFFGKYIRGISKNAQKKVADSNTIVEETLQAISTVKSFTNELYELKRYKKTIKEVVNISLKGAKWRGLFASFIIFCLFGAIVSVIWYGVLLVNEGNFSIGNLFKFILYSVFIAASFGGLADLFSQIQNAIGATDHLMDLLDENTEKINKTENQNNISIQGFIKFENLSFSYPTRSKIPVLKNINFEVNPGERVALVGPSGAGKSTIASLLLRFYNPVKGKILIDKKDISEYPISFIRSQIALVPQDLILFGTSIKENIAYGKPRASDEEILDAAKKANAHDFINSFTKGYETIVGDRGVQLSGGQRQRIAIARAILKNPKILILDEATSSLDSQSEKMVQDALDKLMKGRTSIIIAHRLSTIINCDKIIVLDKGEIKESGTHFDLLKQNGFYSHLYKLQFEEQEINF